MALKSNKSFSLFEVIITVAIFTTTVVAILRSVTTVIASANIAGDTTLACFLAEDKFWEIEYRSKYNKEPLISSGRQVFGAKDFNWNYETQDTESGHLKGLKLFVRWPENAGREYSIEFLSYMYKKS